MQQNWEAEMSQRIGRQVQRSRKELKLSAQGLADRTAELGHAIGRATISDLENKRRQSVTIAELLILAAALHISPTALLYGDEFADGLVELLPNVASSAARAALWFAGEIPVRQDDEPGTAQAALDLVRLRQSQELAAAAIALDNWNSATPSQRNAHARIWRDQTVQMAAAMDRLGLKRGAADSTSASDHAAMHAAYSDLATAEAEADEAMRELRVIVAGDDRKDDQ